MSLEETTPISLDENLTFSNLSFFNSKSQEVHEGMAANFTDNGLYIPREIIIGVNMYGLPIIIFVGLLGNTMAFAVFVASQFRHQSSSVYLAFLNFVDSLFLLCLLITQLEWYNIYLMRIEGLCQLVIYLSYVSAFLSVWTVVSFTVERFVVVYFPLMRLVHCTRRRAIYVVLSLLVGALFLYNYAVWTSQVQDYHESRNCVHMARYAYFLNVTAFLDTFITLVIPSLVVVLLNILIVLKVCNCVGRRSEMEEDTTFTTETGNDSVQLSGRETRNNWPLNGTESNGERPLRSNQASCNRLYSTSSSRQSSIRHQSPTSLCCLSCMGTTPQTPRAFSIYPRARRTRAPGSSLRRHNSRSQAQQMKTTRTLLIISTLFVVLNLPSHAFRVWVTITPPLGMPSRTMLVWQLLFQFLYYVNFSCNFFLYCACSQSFRLELKAMILKCRRNIKTMCCSWCQTARQLRCGKS